MLVYHKDKLYMEVDKDTSDALCVELLKEGRELCKKSIDIDLTSESTAYVRSENLRENYKYLEAFDTLIEYYGG